MSIRPHKITSLFPVSQALTEGVGRVFLAHFLKHFCMYNVYA